MKEFKFWATPFSHKQLLLFAIPVWIILALIIIFIDIEKYFYYLFIFMIFWFIIVVPVFLLKRVKIILSEDNIQIYYYGRIKYSGNINNLEYIRGTDIDKGKGATNFELVFSDKQYKFVIMESNKMVSPTISKQTEILRELVIRYSLQKEYYKNVFMDTAYTYINPRYNPSASDESNYNKKER